MAGHTVLIEPHPHKTLAQYQFVQVRLDGKMLLPPDCKGHDYRGLCSVAHRKLRAFDSYTTDIKVASYHLQDGPDLDEPSRGQHLDLMLEARIFLTPACIVEGVYLVRIERGAVRVTEPVMGCFYPLQRQGLEAAAVDGDIMWTHPRLLRLHDTSTHYQRIRIFTLHEPTMTWVQHLQVRMD